MHLTLILVIAIVATVKPDYTSVLNQIVDDVIQLSSDEIKDLVTLDHVTFPYTYKWLFITKKGTVDCHNGQIKSLQSLKRTEDTKLIVNKDSSLKLQVGLGLQDFGFTFGQCTVDWFMVPRGPLSGHVGTNSIALLFNVEITKPASLDSNITCVASIEDITLNKYSNVAMKLSGSGVLHWIEEKILNLVAGGDSARKMFNGVIESELREKLPKFELLIRPILQLYNDKNVKILQQ